MSATPADIPFPSAAPAAAPSPVMGMLQDHLPLTLLLDLAFGVRSREVYAVERPDLSWLPRGVVSRAS